MQKEMTLREKAQKLYEYAFTIVWTDAMTSGDRAFYTTLRHNRKFIEAERRMYKPNQDTLYSFLPIQLEHTPYILEIPELEDKSRYLLVNILNLKTEMVLTKGTKNEKTVPENTLFCIGMPRSRKHTKIIFRFGVRIPEIILSSGWNRTGKKTIKSPMPSRISL